MVLMLLRYLLSLSPTTPSPSGWNIFWSANIFLLNLLLTFFVIASLIKGLSSVCRLCVVLFYRLLNSRSLFWELIAKFSEFFLLWIQDSDKLEVKGPQSWPIINQLFWDVLLLSLIKPLPRKQRVAEYTLYDVKERSQKLIYRNQPEK